MKTLLLAVLGMVTLLNPESSWALTKTITCPALTATSGNLNALPTYLKVNMVSSPLPSSMTSISAVSPSLAANVIWCNYNNHISLKTDAIGTGQLINCSNPVLTNNSYQLTCGYNISTSPGSPLKSPSIQNNFSF